MIVDDSPSVNALLEMMLKKENYRVESFENGLDAVESARKDPPALIIMDANMPKMNGLEATRKIKGSSITASVPVIIASGEDKEEEVSKALEAGADEYVIKPYDFRVLLNKIKEVFG